MTSDIRVKPGQDWSASGGLFDFVLEFLVPRMSDRKAAEWLRTVVDNNLGSVWLTDFPAATQEEIGALLRAGLITEAQQALPEGPAKARALELLQELVDLTLREP